MAADTNLTINVPIETEDYIDKISLERIATLHPKIRDTATLAMVNANFLLKKGRSQVRVDQGYRSFDEQNALYKKIPKVTNSKGGQSYHNYGLALDIVLIIDGITASWNTTADWNKDNQSDWMEVVAIFKTHSFTWGGDWVKFKDMPHFEMIFGHNWRDLLEMYNLKKFIVGTQYLNI